MAEMKLNMETVEKLLQKLKEHGASRIKIKNDEFEITVENRQQAAAVYTEPDKSAETLNVKSAEVEQTHTTQTQTKGSIVKSPLIGTFYTSPSPQNPPFVTVGQKVSKGEVLFIIESMKLMNEIKSDYDGVVKEILVQNGDSVDYNQPVMRIE